MNSSNRVSSALHLVLACCCVAGSAATASDLDETIHKVRMGTLVVEAEPGVEVRIEQLRHEFWFGAALANQPFGGRMDPEDQARYRRVFLENFNAAVTENALKWHVMEPRQGHVDYSVVDAILEWTEQHEIPLRGHNIFWGIPNRVQSWQKALDDDALRESSRPEPWTSANASGAGLPNTI
jgi:GH35 family endo-1,4-beta-xylanase